MIPSPEMLPYPSDISYSQETACECLGEVNKMYMFLLFHGWRSLVYLMVQEDSVRHGGEAGQQDPEAAGHIVSAVRKQREKNTDAQLIRTPIHAVNLPTKLIQKLPHEEALRFISCQFWILPD